jgi:hypothetical protein
MSTHNDYVKMIINQLNKIPQKYEDRNLEMVYQQGFLIGAIAEMMLQDNQIAHTVKNTLEKLSKHK